jgi:hypothetical protein
MCRVAFLPGLLVFAPCGAGHAEEPPPAPPVVKDVAAQVEAWLKDLTSESYEVREAARKGLERRGREAPDVLRAHAEDADPEVRRTVRSLLERLGSVSARPTAGVEDLAAIGLVRLDVKARALGEVLGEVGEALGGAFVVEDGAGRTPVTLHLEDVAYFAAVDALAAVAKLRPAGPFDGEGRLALVPLDASRPAPPSSAVGPVRVRATKVSVSRALEGREDPTHTLTLEVQLAPCVQLVSYRTPRVVRALDTRGNAWLPAGNVQPSLVHGAGSEVRRVEVTVALDPPEGGVERLATLDVVLPLRLRHERHAARFAPVDALPKTIDERGRPAEAGTKGTVTLVSVAPVEGRTDAWIAELSAVLSSATARESAEAWFRAAGNPPRRLWIGGGRTTGPDGRLRLVGRAFGVKEPELDEILVAWFDRESEGELAVTLTNVPLR